MTNTMEKGKNILTPEELKEFQEDDFPFENIAFEGGGSKGTAQKGVVRVLEEIGVWKNIKRFAGTSAGAMVATCGALGYDSYEMEEKIAEGTAGIFDAIFKYLAFVPNMLIRFGWNPGRAMEKLVGKVLKERLGNANATFEDLYKKTKRELCVVVSNISQMDCIYCHVKTTPSMPIKEAVRMSVSLPGVLIPVKKNGQYFIDGGFVNNYPIRVFDGWYLSMQPRDNFLVKIPELVDVAAAWDPNTQFGDQPNAQTIGVVLYSTNEKEMFKQHLDKRADEHAPNVTPLPDTELVRERKKTEAKLEAIQKQHDDQVAAMTAFIGLISKHTDVKMEMISKNALEHVLDQAGDEFTDKQKAIIFGEGKSTTDIVNTMDSNQDGQITVRELTRYAESNGIEVRNVFRGFKGKNIKNLKEYFSAIYTMLQLNSKRVFFERNDLTRTIGVDTGYLGTLDLEMEEDDTNYLLKQGKRGCIAFLRYYKTQAA